MHHNNRFEQRREALEERREEREEHRSGGRFGDRGEHQRGILGLGERLGFGEDRREHLHEDRGERLHEDRRERLYEDRGERLHDNRREHLHEDSRERLYEDRGELQRERREEHLRPQHYDQDMPHYAPPPGPPPGGYSKADFVSDDDFQRMMRNGEFENGSTRPTANAGYQPSYQQPPSQAYQRYPEPPLPSVAHEQRQAGSGYESGTYSQPHNNYAPPAGPPGAHSSHAPAGGFNLPPGPPPQSKPSYASGYGTSQAEGGGRGAASEYYNEPSPESQAPMYSHNPNTAAARVNSSNPALYQQYNEAAQGPHESYQAQQHHPSGEFDEQKYSSHFAAHAQAYGSDPDGKPMANDDIGAAAAVEALKITATNNQQSNARPQQGGRPQGGFQSGTNTPQGGLSGAQQSGRPGDGKPHGRPQNEEDDEEQAAKPQAPTGGGSPQDKIIALAMAQAGKLFDKKGTGDNQGKTQAMQVAAATAMRMMTEYKSTGKVDMQPGEMQKLMGLAMSLF